LEERIEPSIGANVFSRRELGRRLGLASLAALPLILSMETPVAAQAATCLPLGSGCITNASCCTGLCINNTCVCIGQNGPCTVDAQCCSTRCGSALNKCLP
ncbi:MAG: hypothetical protein LC731_01270, partial [Acidobacteria bacterium]|nr:hypothetical protein [Acidobacteriota bacterium]